MAKGTRRDRGKTKNQRKEQIERKRDERSHRNAMKKEKRANEYGIDDDTFKSFRNQLQVQGLKMRDVVGDGNCLFRALADQLDGDENMHGKHRKETVSYMKEHEGEFIPFLEETVTFERYLKNLSSPGTYGGNDSVVAFARNNNANIIIHQHNNPTFIIEGSHANAKKIIIHLAYHDYEHYSSIRRCNDPGTGPACIFHKERDSIPTERFTEEKHDEEVTKIDEEIKEETIEVEERDDFISEAVIKISHDSGYEDSEYIRNAFVDNSYDLDATLSFILQTMSLGENERADEQCLNTESSEITQSDDTCINKVVANENAFILEEKECSVNSESSLVSCQEVPDERNCEEEKTSDSKCTCNKNEIKSSDLKCSSEDIKSSNSKCNCYKDNEEKEKSFQEGKKKKTIPVDRSVKKPTNRQRKELAKQARKKRRQEDKKDSDINETNDTSPPLLELTNIKSINI